MHQGKKLRKEKSYCIPITPLLLLVVACPALSSNDCPSRETASEGFFKSPVGSDVVLRANVMAGDLATAWGPSRIEILLFRETRSVLEYLHRRGSQLQCAKLQDRSHNFPIIAVLSRGISESDA